VVKHCGYDPIKLDVRLNWGSPETSEIVASDLISAAEKNLIRRMSFERMLFRFWLGVMGTRKDLKHYSLLENA
jgi:hypothetical protein